MSANIEADKQVILIIDDNPTNLKVAIDYLEAHNFEVVVARSGESGLQRAKFARPDLILLDILMPELDGFETCRRLKAETASADIPVIFLTVRTETVDKVEGFTVGGVDYITKPIELEEVLARIQTHLTIRDLQRQLKAHNQHLEQRVQARTAELAASNQALQHEITRRKRHQQEKDKLFDVVRQQGEQLRALTNWLLESQQNKHQALAKTLRDQVEQKLHLLEFNLNQIRELVNNHATSQLLVELITPQLDNSAQVLAQIKADMFAVKDDLVQPIPEAHSPLVRLSGREKEVLQLIADGKSTTDIAQLLYLSTSTVYTHRQHIMEKLDIDNASDLVKFTLHHQLNRNYYDAES